MTADEVGASAVSGYRLEGEWGDREFL